MIVQDIQPNSSSKHQNTRLDSFWSQFSILRWSLISLRKPVLRCLYRKNDWPKIPKMAHTCDLIILLNFRQSNRMAFFHQGINRQVSICETLFPICFFSGIGDQTGRC